MEDTNSIRILKTAKHLFNTRGYRNVTVQELASELGMSKKTIYRYFDGKDAIVAAIIQETEKKIDHYMKKCELQQEDPLIALKDILLSVANDTLGFSSVFLMDIQKYLPGLASEYKQFRQNGKQVAERLLVKAHERGLIKNIPIHLVMEILHESLHVLSKPEFLAHNSYSMTEVLETYIDIFFSGIAAPKTK